MNHLLVWYTIRIAHASIGMVKYTISIDRDFFWKNNSKYYLWDYEMNHYLVSYTIWIVSTNNKKSEMYYFTWQRLFNQNVIVNITFEIVKWTIWQLEFLECSFFGILILILIQYSSDWILILILQYLKIILDTEY